MAARDADGRRPRRRLRRPVVVAGLAVLVAAVLVGAVLWSRRGPTRSTAALCSDLTAARGLDASFVTLDPATLTPQAKALSRAAQVAPADIEPQVRTLSGFVNGLVDELGPAQGDRQTALTKALASRQDQVPEVESAGSAIQSWASAHCGLALGGTTLPPSTTP